MTTTAGGGQGTLCLGGAIGRYVGPRQIRRARGNGTTPLQLDLDTIPQPMGLVVGTVGETWNLQAWYRDANPGVTSNLTNAVGGHAPVAPCRAVSPPSVDDVCGTVSKSHATL